MCMKCMYQTARECLHPLRACRSCLDLGRITLFRSHSSRQAYCPDCMALPNTRAKIPDWRMRINVGGQPYKRASRAKKKDARLDPCPTIPTV